MSFRDDSDAMRARIEELERDLERAQARIGELERDAEEATQLRARVAELERALAAAKPAEKPKELSRREKRAVREAQKAATAPEADTAFVAWLKGDNTPTKVLLGLAATAFAGGLAYWQFAPPTWTNSLAPPSIGLIDLGRTPTPPMVHGSTVGERATPVGCVGMIPGAPHLVLRTAREGGGDRAAPTLVLVDVESAEDTVLVVLDAEGNVHCDDDGGGGHNPHLSVPLPAGEARVWVGTYSAEEHADFSMTLATREGAAIPDARGIAPDASPRFGTLDQPFGGTRRFDGTVLGVTHATSIDARCPGYIETEPTLTLQLAEPMYVDLNAGGGDLTFFLESDGTIRCDDDSGLGTQPRLTELLSAGTHHLWVGTYARQTAPLTMWLEARMVSRSSASDAPLERLSREAPVEVAPRSEAMVRECDGLVPVMADMRVELSEPLDVNTSAALLVVDAGGRRCLLPGVTTWSAGVHEVYLHLDAEDPQHLATAATLRASAPSVLPYR